MKTSHLVQSGSASIAAESIGDGPPIVFLHANVADSRMWRAQMESIGTDHLAIAYDRRGFGKTVTGHERFSAVSDLMTVIDAISDGSPESSLAAHEADGSQSTLSCRIRNGFAR
ncbi:alpha/beta fold hydrolase [Nisaea sp.]|uniref:alpha/beta fold hydrolase n=1 Tax=Nisaea sp. TaxID=2024842 RepID=UPI003296BC5C